MPSSNDDFSGGIELPAICNFEIVSKTTTACMFMGEISKLINCVETNEPSENVSSEIDGVIILDARKRVELKGVQLSVFGPMKLMLGSRVFNIAISKNQNFSSRVSMRMWSSSGRASTSLVSLFAGNTQRHI